MLGGEAPAARGLRPGDPRQLGGYRIVSRLGEGGMGSVYLAEDSRGVAVAIKVIRHGLADDPEFRRRFRSEVARAKQVPPFCTAEVLDADTEHEPPYLVVEYVDGPSLASVVQDRGPLSPANQHGIAVGVAVALTAIHGAGVIHRDLKPANVLLAPGSPKVIDFGIARAAEGSEANTRTDQMVGTVSYMSPERFGPDARETLTPAADIFAWGAVVAFAATGRTPFAADTPAAVAIRIMSAPPDLEGLTGPLRTLVEQALAKNPADRPTARELVDHLLSGGAVTPRPAAFAEQPEVLAAAGISSTVTQELNTPYAPPVSPGPASPPRPWLAQAPGAPAAPPTPPAAPLHGPGSAPAAGPAPTAVASDLTHLPPAQPPTPTPAFQPARTPEFQPARAPVPPPYGPSTPLSGPSGPASYGAPPHRPNHAPPHGPSYGPPASGAPRSPSGYVSAPPPGAPVRRRRAPAVIIATLLLVVGLLAGTLVAFATGKFSLGGTTPTSPVTTGTTNPRTSGPDPSPSTGLTRRLDDSFSAGTLWQERVDAPFQAECLLSDGLLVSLNTELTYRCPGTTESWTDFTVNVSLRLVSSRSCAGIWFRYTNELGGYALRVCEDGLYLMKHKDTVQRLQTYAGTTSLDRVVTVGIVATGDQLRFYRDGQPVGGFTDSSLTRGRIVLGIFQVAAGATPPFNVQFKHIEILTPAGV